VRSLLPAYILYLATVFAMTVHKSQGSEYGQVMLLLPKGTEGRLLTKELLYTAVTRAKQKVFIQATSETLMAMAGIAVHRASGIRGRIKEI